MKRIRKLTSFIERLEPLLNSLNEPSPSDLFFELSQGKKVVIHSIEQDCFPFPRHKTPGTAQDVVVSEHALLERLFCRVLRAQDAKVKEIKQKKAVSFWLGHQYEQVLTWTEAEVILDYLALVLFGLARGINYGYTCTSLSFLVSGNKEVVIFHDEIYFGATQCLLKYGLVEGYPASRIFMDVKASFVLGVFYQLFSLFQGSILKTTSKVADASASFSPSEHLLCRLDWELPRMSPVEIQFVNSLLRTLADTPTFFPMEKIQAYCLNSDISLSSQSCANFGWFLDECFSSWNTPIHRLETLQDLGALTGFIEEEDLPPLLLKDSLNLRDLFVLGEEFLLPVLRYSSLPF